MQASDWYLFVLMFGLFVFGVWLIVGEVRKSSKRRTELYGKRPSSIRLFNSMFRRHRRLRLALTIPALPANAWKWIALLSFLFIPGVIVAYLQHSVVWIFVAPVIFIVLMIGFALLLN
jgi:hypothetical protein